MFAANNRTEISGTARRDDHAPVGVLIFIAAIVAVIVEPLVATVVTVLILYTTQKIGLSWQVARVLALCAALVVRVLTFYVVGYWVGANSPGRSLRMAVIAGLVTAGLFTFMERLVTPALQNASGASTVAEPIVTQVVTSIGSFAIEVGSALAGGWLALKRRKARESPGE